MQSYAEETAESRVKRGQLPFSIQARNSTGHSLIGFANDRILKRFKHFKKDKGWRWSVISKDGSIHLPTLVAIVVAALGALTIFALCIWYKTTRKIGLKCCAGLQQLDDNVSRASGSSTETTSEHIYSNDGTSSRWNMDMTVWSKLKIVICKKITKIALGTREIQNRDDR